MSVEEIREKLPIKNIPAIVGEPTYKAINKVREALYENSGAIPTTLGRERNGHIGLIMYAEVYANVLTMAYASPTEPGSYSQHGTGNSEATQANANVIHKEGRIIYDLDKNVDAELKQEIIAALEETYLSTKIRGTWGFTESLPRTSWTIWWRGTGKSGLQT